MRQLIVYILAALVACIGFAAASISIESIDAIKENVILKNNESTDINLAGWTLTDASTRAHVLTLPSFVLGAGKTCTVNSWNNSKNITADIYLGSKGRGIWNNDGDTCTLKNPQNETIDTFTY